MTTASSLCLPDTSLCAIVRDEMMNPAGGIVDFIESTVPFVEQAVIVDTGSKDGTRQALFAAQRRYPTLSVPTTLFHDYASARNLSLERVRTRYALVLDADERLTRDDFIELQTLIQDWPAHAYNFQVIDVHPSGEETRADGHNPRLFVVDEQFRYTNLTAGYSEILRLGEGNDKPEVECLNHHDPRFVVVMTSIRIKQFLASPAAQEKKAVDWYLGPFWQGGDEFPKAPSDVPSFREWKAYNPQRKRYR